MNALLVDLMLFLLWLDTPLLKHDRHPTSQKACEAAGVILFIELQIDAYYDEASKENRG
jgi:hypothetical protein